MIRSPRVRWVCFTLLVAGWSSHRQPDARPGVDFRPPPDFAAKAAAYMKARVRVTGFSGAVLVAHEGRAIFRKGYGLANHEFGVANTPRTKFRIGSVGKQFTAAAILLLEQRGKLSVTDLVSRHLPDWPKAWDAVTLHHLLSHTGGLPRLTTQALLDVSALSRVAPAPFRGIRDLFKPGEELQPLDFQPGENWAYSNVGYIVLGMVVEKVSGRPYRAFLRNELFGPLRMTDTDCEEPGMIMKRRASGYTRIDGTLANASYVDMRFPGGAGAVYSTVEDLLLWDRALTSHRLLSPAATSKLFTLVRSEYAYGWWVQTKFQRRAQWHRGNVSGFVAIIARYPDERLFIAVLSNVDRTQVRATATELAAIALGAHYDLPREHKEIEADPASYDALVGTYRKAGQHDDTFAVARDGSRLVIQIPPGQTVFEIFPESGSQFFAKWGEYYLTFIQDRAGNTTHVLIRNEGEEFRWIRVR
jgi:CubicO group peptidase (beta-lactamase class C family)